LARAFSATTLSALTKYPSLAAIPTPSGDLNVNVFFDDSPINAYVKGIGKEKQDACIGGHILDV
jgi:hypothetical protein